MEVSCDAEAEGTFSVIHNPSESEGDQTLDRLLEESSAHVSTSHQVYQPHRYGSNANASSSSGAALLRAQSIDQGTGALSFHDINYTVQAKLSLCGKSFPKQILKGINGIFKPGMNAILGPTGSGKSSLLDILAGRKEPRGLSGCILLDGSPIPDNFKCLVGYVVQDDVVMGTLTVRENFAFSANLRLPGSTTKEEKNQRIEQVIHELGLTGVADAKVGNEFIRGVSGGERKRCNIGMELIISPPVLFLDEPTTGLDASTANAVLMLLKRLSQRGRSIIFSIHQPRFSIYRLFDTLMLLHHGNVAYHGPSVEAMSFFSSIGYECEAYNNPPDFFLDVINGDSTAVTSMQRDEENLQGKQEELQRNQQLDQHVVGIEGISLSQLFRESVWYKKVQEELQPIYDRYMNSSSKVPIRVVEYKTSFLTQLVTVSKRAILNLIRNPQTTIMQFIVIAIFALIVGGVYYQSNSSKDTGIQNRSGAFFFIIMNQVFGNMSAVELFIKERSIFIHENVSGFYRVSAYFLAKVFCDVLPMRLIPAAIFSCISYFMIGLRDGGEHFLIFSLVLFLTALSASALSFAISSTVRIFAMANLSLALSYVFMMLFSGFLVNVGDLGDWISWIKYLSIFRFSLNTLSINELKDHEFCNNKTDCISGNSYLKTQQIDYETEWDLWQNVAALGIITVGFMCLAYIQLRRLKKLK